MSAMCHLDPFGPFLTGRQFKLEYLAGLTTQEIPSSIVQSKGRPGCFFWCRLGMDSVGAICCKILVGKETCVTVVGFGQ